MTESEKLIAEIQEELTEAADSLKAFRFNQEAAVAFVVQGDFGSAVLQSEAAVVNFSNAQKEEKKAAKLLVELIPQMKKDGFADAIIFGVVESLIADFNGA